MPTTTCPSCHQRTRAPEYAPPRPRSYLPGLVGMAALPMALVLAMLGISDAVGYGGLAGILGASLLIGAARYNTDVHPVMLAEWAQASGCTWCGAVPEPAGSLALPRGDTDLATRWGRDVLVCCTVLVLALALA